MSAGHTLRRRVLKLLMTNGSWVDRTDLNHLTALQSCLEDTLADLVMEKVLEFKRGCGYRMACLPVQRAAMAQLQADPKLKRAFKVERQAMPELGPQMGRFVMGVADRSRLHGDPIDAVVTFCLELPPHRFDEMDIHLQAIGQAMTEPLAPAPQPGPQSPHLKVIA